MRKNLFLRLLNAGLDAARRSYSWFITGFIYFQRKHFQFFQSLPKMTVTTCPAELFAVMLSWSLPCY
jgi:hypothetical protein